jgi:hypothetical protein
MALKISKNIVGYSVKKKESLVIEEPKQENIHE